jgi:hypothetical protein
MPFPSPRRLRELLAVCAFAGTSAGAIADQTSIVATPEPIPSEAPGISCTYPDFVTIQDAFATPITDVVTLRFIAFVENLQPKDRAATLERILVPQLPVARTQIQAAEQIGCTQPRIGVRTARLLYSISTRWTGTTANDALVKAARTAIGALQIRDRIGVATLDSTLAPFGTSYQSLAAPVALASCTPDRAAQTVAAIQPIYPPLAGQNGIGGSVLVKVSLDSEGLVTAASVFKRDVPANEAGDELARVSLAAAATSNYAPAIMNCHPLDGTYLFKADFHLKRF